PYDKTLYKQRHKVENMSAKLKDWRRIATRYDSSHRHRVYLISPEPKKVFD
ncbi:MAG: transposase, partial [Alphaproteobacteria bacterium]|nr:transposase [Alphaproteobacteria bacterium]